MRKAIRLFCFALASVLLCCDSGAGASSLSGQSYETFSKYYKENISFINENDNRHLLPLVFTKRADELADGRIYYELLGDTLTAVVSTDPTGEVIESCVVTLTAPPGMEYANPVYTDFAISGYHSYALLMAMHTDPEPAHRYGLVRDVVAGMAEGDGHYTRQLGVYTLTCTRTGSVAVLEFQNNRVQPAPSPGESPVPEGTDSPLEVIEIEEDGLL